MGRRGPKPTPNALKLARGTQPCRLNPAAPEPPPGLPAPPAYLKAEALDLWHELAPILHAMGVLTLADRHAFALLCESHAMLRADPTDLKRRGEVRRLLAEFGLTPSSRSSLKTETKAADTDPLAALIASRKKTS